MTTMTTTTDRDVAVGTIKDRTIDTTDEVMNRDGMKDSSSSSSLHSETNGPSRRFLAKQKMRDTWASHRQSMDPSKKKTKPKAVGAKPVVPRQVFPPSFCLLCRQAWMQTSKGFHRPSTRSSSLSSNGNVESKKAMPTTGAGPTKTKPTAFPSVYQILQKSAVNKQMKSLEEEQHKQQQQQQQENRPEEEEEKTRGLDAVSVLPSGYDWQRAIQHLSKGRKRAFVLLDLAAMIQAHFDLNQSIPRPCRVQWTCRVDHNREQRVLELWNRLGVGLRCNSKYDLLHLPSHSTHNNNGNNQHPSSLLLDDAGRVRKPDGYLQRLYEKGVRTFVVDGPDEVDRIHNVIVRRHGLHGDDLGLSYTIRLDESNQTQWSERVKETAAAASTLQHQITGISVSFPSDETALGTLQDCLKPILTACLRITDMFLLDLTHLTVDKLTNAQKSFLLDMATNHDNLSFSIDASDLLIVNAGALCTRINGIKKNTTTTTTSSNSSSNGATTATINYYIDDGCYGSLCQQTHYSPLPLYPADGKAEKCVVWGPTCDGLDKVCETVLPPLHQGDWLVFPRMGSVGGLGTSFNGFDPPDAVYCVMGYFRKHG